jgi:hypothetical protein
MALKKGWIEASMQGGSSGSKEFSLCPGIAAHIILAQKESQAVFGN